MGRKVICVLALCFAGSTVQASSLVGDWSGFGTPVTIGIGGNGADQLAQLDFTSATPNDGVLDLLGTVDVTCVGYSASQCGSGGNINVSGTLSPSGVLDVSLPSNPNAFAGSYSGGNSFTGVITSLNGDVYDWTFSSKAAAAPEIDPAGILGGITLLAGGLAVLRARRCKAFEVSIG
jgi:hypothetical protein